MEPGAFHDSKQVVSGDTAVLEFETSVDGKYVNGVDIIRCDDAGRIVEFRVMMRPLQGIQAVHEQMGRLLTCWQLIGRGFCPGQLRGLPRSDVPLGITENGETRRCRRRISRRSGERFRSGARAVCRAMVVPGSEDGDPSPSEYERGGDSARGDVLLSPTDGSAGRVGAGRRGRRTTP